MPRKKKSEESSIEEVEKAIKKIGKNVEEGIEKLKEKSEDIIEIVKETFQEKQEKKKIPEKTKKETKESDNKETKLAALKEKAKQLEKTLEEQEIKSAEIKQKVHEEEKADTLVPIEDYLKSSIHLGTRVITPHMKQFVYKRRADGLAVFNTSLIDKKLRESADFLAKFAPEDIILVCKREAGWKPIELFSKITGIHSFTKKYPAGILTNPNLEEFMETELVFICDPWLDKNALEDAKRIRIPVLAICDTNNYTAGVTRLILGNNKSAKSLGMIFYLLAKLYTEKRKMNVSVPPITEWVEGWDTLQPPK